MCGIATSAYYDVKELIRPTLVQAGHVTPQNLGYFLFRDLYFIGEGWQSTIYVAFVHESITRLQMPKRKY